MTIISRFIPNSTPTRIKVLTTAKEKKDGLPPAGNIFSANTTARLDTIQPLLETAANTVAIKKAHSVFQTGAKQAKAVTLHLLVSHFVQVFNFGVERNKFQKAERAFYKLDTETGNLPSIITDAQLEQVAKDIVDGDAARVLEEPTPMSNPTAAEVKIALTEFLTTRTDQSNALLELDAAQQGLQSHVEEADKVIKKVYDEAETNYNEETPESQRANCRLWGVIYLSIGNDTTVTVQVKHIGTNVPVVGAAVKLVEAAGKTLLTDATGTVVFVTKVNGPASLEIYLDPTSPTPDKAQDITIVESVPLTVEVEM